METEENRSVVLHLDLEMAPTSCGYCGKHGSVCQVLKINNCDNCDCDRVHIICQQGQARGEGGDRPCVICHIYSHKTSNVIWVVCWQPPRMIGLRSGPTLSVSPISGMS